MSRKRHHRRPKTGKPKGKATDSKPETVKGLRASVLRRLPARAWALTAAIATLASLTVTATYLRPHTSVAVLEAAAVPDPFAARFVITNDNPYTIGPVEAVCMLMRVRTLAGKAPLPIQAQAETAAKVLLPQERTTFTCRAPPSLPNGHLYQEVDLHFGVMYELPILKRNHMDLFRFVTSRSPSGGFHWHQQSVVDGANELAKWYDQNR